MIRGLIICILCWAPISLCSAGGTTRVQGIWAYVEKWEAAPKDVAPGRFTSRAIVLRFCADGQFVMAKCVLYRYRNESINIGPNDGLEIYRGRWSASGEGASITYRLVDYEVAFTGVQSAMKKDITALARFAGKKLRMPVVRLDLDPPKVFETTFVSEALLPARLGEKFIQCDGMRDD